jgi:hypothetical protein
MCGTLQPTADRNVAPPDGVGGVPYIGQEVHSAALRSHRSDRLHLARRDTAGARQRRLRPPGRAEQATRQTKQDAKFKKAVKTLKTRAQFVKARTATIVQKKSVDTFHDKVQAEQADSEQVKAGRQELLEGLSLYNVGLERFRKALTEAIRTNGRGGVKKAKSALKTLNHAVDMVASGAKKIHG